MKKSQRDEDSAPQPGDRPKTESEAFGAWLRQHREVRGIDLREIADSSKIGIVYLRAFEEERFDLLPAPVFAKGFLRQYAAYVGIDPEEAVTFFLSACQENAEGSPDETVPRQRVQSSSSSRFVGLAALVALVLISAFWALGQRDRTAAEADPTSSLPALPSPPSSAPSPEPTVDASEPALEPTVAANAGSVEPGIGAPTESPAAPLRVVVDFSGECWIEAMVDGAQRHAEIKVQGESLVMEAQEAVDLKVGDSRMVQIEVNGLPYALAERPGTSVRSVRIDRATLESLAADAAPKGGE